jgi:hypothetical protein
MDKYAKLTELTKRVENLNADLASLLEWRDTNPEAILESIRETSGRLYRTLNERKKVLEAIAQEAAFVATLTARLPDENPFTMLSRLSAMHQAQLPQVKRFGISAYRNGALVYFKPEAVPEGTKLNFNVLRWTHGETNNERKLFTDQDGMYFIGFADETYIIQASGVSPAGSHFVASLIIEPEVLINFIRTEKKIEYVVGHCVVSLYVDDGTMVSVTDKNGKAKPITPKASGRGYFFTGQPENAPYTVMASCYGEPPSFATKVQIPVDKFSQLLALPAVPAVYTAQPAPQ